MTTTLLTTMFGLGLLLVTAPAQRLQKVPLSITGGHETDPRDHGRPVILVANGLGVKPEIFRDAFSHVKPAPAGTEPDSAQVRRNKTALLTALSPYGITNELLDKVSDYYRYQPGADRLWRNKPAKAFAIIDGNRVKSITITDPGAGYSSAPVISVPGYPELKFEVKLGFGRDLKTNGSIASISLHHE